MLIRRAVFTSGALALIAAGAYALVQAAKPVNAKCPVKTGEAAKADITTTYKGKTIGFCWGGCKNKFSGNPDEFAANIPELKGGGAAPKPDDKKNDGIKPLNAMCPVRTDQRAKNDITVESAGKAIGFCCNQCKNKFLRAPGSYINNIPELKGGSAKSADKKGDKSDDKPDKPAVTGPCEVKKTVKGYWCVMCKRELTQDDVRGNLCKKCETKPEEIEYCLKLIPKPIQVKSGKPLPPEFNEDKARISYVCEKCNVKGDIESQLKHKDDCKPGFGSGFKKVCAKSGKMPHASD